MSGSPIEQFLSAADRLDLEAMTAMLAPGISLLLADGRRAEGAEAAGELLSDYLSNLRFATHAITQQWHQDDVWIAEVEATYELRDRLRLSSVPRAFILRAGDGGVVEFHVYGARELRLDEHRTGGEGMRIGGRWVPPL